MASYTDMNSSEFYLARKKIMAETGLSKEVVIATRNWIFQIGLIRATNRSVNGSKVYKFTSEIKMSTEAALLTAQHTVGYKSPLKNIKRLKTPQPEQQILLSENSDTLLSENSDTLLSENSDTKEEPKIKKKTSCENEALKSSPILQKEAASFEGEEGFLFLRKILKRSNQIDKMKMLSKKHSLYSLKCHHQKILNEIESGGAVKSIGVFLSRLDIEDEWRGKFPMAIKSGGGKTQASQTYINLISEVKGIKENSAAPKEENVYSNLGANFREMLAAQ